MKKGLVTAFVVGLLLILFIGVNPSTFVEIDQGILPIAPESIGEIVEIRGDGLVKAPHQDFFHKASQGQRLIPLHKLVTGFDSQILVSLGEKFWLMPNSQIKIDEQNGQKQVHLLSGTVKRFQKEKNANLKTTTSFFIEGQMTDLALLERAGSPQLTSIPLGEIALEVKDTKQQVIPPSISEKQIHETFGLQKRFIEKCFISHYSRQSGKTQSGKVWVRFIVNSDGKLQEPVVTRSDYDDGEFHQCLKDIVSRVRLKGYSGNPTNVEFPIAIELPN